MEASWIPTQVPAWLSGLRSPPNVDKALILRFLPIAALHCFGHGLQVSSMGAGSVFFTHVIKATEPVIGMVVLLAFTGKIAPWSVNLCMAPIVGGVARVRRADGSLANRGAAATRIVRRGGSRRRRGRDADSPRRRVAAAPRPRRR